MASENLKNWYFHYLSLNKMWSCIGYFVMLLLFLLADEYISRLQWAVDITEFVTLYRVSFFVIGMVGVLVLWYLLFTYPEEY